MTLTGKSSQYVFFDLDGTLLDMRRRWYDLHYDLSKIYRYKPLPKDIYLVLKRSGLQERAIIRKTDIPFHHVNSYLRKRHQRIESPTYLAKDRLKPGAQRLLKKLSASYTLVLLTRRNHRKHCLEEIQRLGIRKYFNEILMSHSLSNRWMLRWRSGKSLSKDAIFIGDTDDDYRSAKKWGVRCILVCDGARDKKSLTRLKPINCRIVDRLTHIYGIVK